jgi:outer membrane protein OmpA-like peptidoglycan-associated protein
MEIKHLRAILMAFIFMYVSGQSFAQTADMKWGLGFHGTIIEPKTSIEDEFFNFEINRTTFGQGLSLSRYLNPSFDLGLFATHGRIEQSLADYRLNDMFYAGTLKLRYKLYNGYLFNEEAIVGPYLAAGLGMINAEVDAFGASEGGLRDDIMQLDIFVGAGVRFRLSEFVSLDWQTGLHMPSDNTWDANTGGDKDQFLEHSLGLVLNLGEGTDTDGDGITDRKDKCPGTPTGIKVDDEGCPLDVDKDGVADYLDECPLLAGIVALKGCPDSDGDGVADIKDACPEVAGLLNLDGCPDSDGDGVADKDDKCANTKAGYKVDATGCPMDKDGDSVIDEEDDCPDQSGSAVLKGCPDRDGDGIADKNDKCPDVVGIPANNGCPELPKEIITQITKIASKIFFESGSDKLKPSSRTQLDDLADILNKYAEADLIVEGHTDNTGDAEKNVLLSEKRCESVKTYLISKGIDGKRLTTTGYGQTRPLDDNTTAAGRAKNRRVELKTQY